MCGILGIFSFKKLNQKKNFQKSLNLIKHRGPDNQGIYYGDNIYLGHNRLSIIDLSKNASQPMFSKNRNYSIVFNGELYNYKYFKKRLINKGYKFFSSSDTEVVLNSYIEWGERIIEKFDGMFAFAIYDLKKNSIFVGRDRYGIKPLYYSFFKKNFVFSSEVKSIKKLFHKKLELDKHAINEYFAFQNILSDRTFYKSVKLFPSGNFLKISLSDLKHDKLNFKEYWDFNFLQKKTKLNKRQIKNKINQLLNKSVNSQLIGDVKIGSYLSSGLDSTKITEIARKKIKKINTFTCGSHSKNIDLDDIRFDESKDAKKIANILKVNNIQYKIKPSDILTSIKKIVFSLEEPRVGQCYPNYYASKLVKKNDYKVVLSGAGADEIFGGYPWRYIFLSKKIKYEKFKKDYYLNIFKLFKTEKKFKKILNSKFKVSNSYLKKCVDTVFDKQFGKNKKFINPDEALSLCLYFEAKTFLKGLLIVEDKLSMINSVETRLPYLNNELVDFSLKIPNNLKLDQKKQTGKKILIETLKNIIPYEFLYKKKQGFSAPDKTWYRKQLKSIIRNKYLTKQNRIFDILNFDLIKKDIGKHFDSLSNQRLLIWSLIYGYEIFKKKNVLISLNKNIKID